MQILIATFLLSSCITPYAPTIRSDDTSSYVVMGQIDSNDSIQTVNVSMSSLISDPKYIAVTGCSVQVLDNNGHRFPLSDEGDGNYSGKISTQYMAPGSVFRVSIKTPDGTDIESDYDTMTSCPPIDTVYYKQESEYVNNVSNEIKEIQLYIDLKGQNSNSHYYRWILTETWEYRSKWPIEWYYDGTVHQVLPPDFSKMICWRTLQIPSVFVLSTKNLTENNYAQFPLNFVGSNTRRLEYGYSLLIKQEALSKASYEFWDKMKLNNSSNGGVYENQPFTIVGNLHNLSNPKKQVLGFFSAVTSQSKRIFIKPIPGLELTFVDYCTKRILKKGVKELLPFEYPAYLDGNSAIYYNVVLTSECVDCTLLGGVNVKPKFWPSEKK